MPPRAGKSAYLKKCSIVVVGSLGKDAKISDVEKWTVNNGGTFNTKITGATTHVICSSDTYKQKDFALPKQYANNKKLQFVKWAWLDETLRERRIKPAKNYLHPQEWISKVDKKAARRQRLLTGKPLKDIEDDETKEVNEPDSNTNGGADIQGADIQSSSPRHDAPQQIAEEERKPLAFDVLIDDNGVTWKVELKGSELPDPEDGDYVLSVLVSNGDEKIYKAQYDYTEGDDETLVRMLGVGHGLSSVRIEFETFYKVKAGRTWSEYYAELKAAATMEVEKEN